MVISWKKTDSNGGNPEYLATGRHKLTMNPRVSLEEIDDHGSTLVLDLITHEDVGYYICEVSSSPPATLRHQVSINGKSSDIIVSNLGKMYLENNMAMPIDVM